MKKKLAIAFLSIAVLITILLALYIPTFIDRFRNRSGAEYERTWVCSDYHISFTSDNNLFPDFPSIYQGELEKDGKIQTITVDVSDNKFQIVHIVEEESDDGIPCEDFIADAWGEYTYSSLFHKFTVTIVEANEDYEYLLSKELVFTC